MRVRQFRVKPYNLPYVLGTLHEAGLSAKECKPFTTWNGGFYRVDHNFDPSKGMCAVEVNGGTRRMIDKAFKDARDRAATVRYWMELQGVPI